MKAEWHNLPVVHILVVVHTDTEYNVVVDSEVADIADADSFDVNTQASYNLRMHLAV